MPGAKDDADRMSWERDDGNANACEWHKDWEPDDGSTCQDCGRLLSLKTCEGCGRSYLNFSAVGGDDVVVAPAITWCGELVCSRCIEDYDDSEDDSGDYDYQDDEDDDWLEDECGLMPPELGGTCTLAGTEHCDFDCPVKHALDDAAEAEIESTTEAESDNPSP